MVARWIERIIRGDGRTVKIVVLDGRTLDPDRQAWAGLAELGDVVVHDFSTAEEIPDRAADAAVLVTNKSPIREGLIATLPELRFITITATGFDCVDLAAARRRGIPVSNVPEYGTSSVAQYVFALLLELCHHVALHADAVRAGEWTRQPDFSLRKTPLRELAGKTMGIAGYGRIGRRVGELARAFGMNILAYDPAPNPAVAADPVTWCDLDELFARVRRDQPALPAHGSDGRPGQSRPPEPGQADGIPDQHGPRGAGCRGGPGRGAERGKTGRRRRRCGLA